MRVLANVFVVTGLLILAGQVFAQNNIQLRVVAQQEVEVQTADGKTEYRLVEAATVFPGDEVIYTIFFKNNGQQTATEIVIDDPIPEHMYLKAGSVFGSGTDVTYSIDAGKNFATPEQLLLSENGQQRRAKPAEYTHIRWFFKQSLDIGAEGMVGFRAILK